MAKQKRSLPRLLLQSAVLLAVHIAMPASATVAVAEAPPSTPSGAAPVDPAAKPFVIADDRKSGSVAPLSANIDSIFNSASSNAAWTARRVRFRDAVMASLAQPAVVQIILVGTGLMFVAAFLRRRRRRRIGWGVLPSRPSLLPHRPDPAP